MRLFIGIELPEELKQALGRLREESAEVRRDFRWARPEGLHLTLRFLGEATPQQHIALQQGLSRLEPHRVFDLQCQGIGVFGSATRPRILWAGVMGDLGPLVKLQRDVERMCIALGWSPEERSYRPHLTLARGHRRPAAPALLQDFLARHSRTPFGSFRARSVTLYNSTMGPGGSVYEPVHKVPLTGDDAAL